MKNNELLELTDEQLIHQMLKLERNLITSSFAHKTGQLEDTTVMRKMRKEIARIKTIQRKREIEQGLEKNKLYALYCGTYDEKPVEETKVKTGFLKGIVDKVSGR